jgi:hypothetical protein
VETIILLVRGRIVLLGLCNFSCVSVLGEGFFWIKYFILCLSMLVLHCWSVFVLDFVSVSRVFGTCVKNICTFRVYSLTFLTKIFLPVSVWTSIAFYVIIFFLFHDIIVFFVEYY